ncbi:type IV pilus assembly protein PilM [Legionella sp.]|uniref:type IV pilus assembly protein PilM n=1 Tax=Legionella sp. TaxID=459 RepID=UPI003CC552CA
MLNSFRPTHYPTLGLDITSTAVKILEISWDGETLCMERYGREALPPHAMDGTVIKDVNIIAFCIKKLCDRLQINSKQVVLAVPDAAVITRIVQINDGLNDEDMEELIVIEAEKYIPYPINEINFDFEILGASEKNPLLLDVLIVATRAENVTNRVEIVTRAGLNAVAVDVESYAVERAAQHLTKNLPSSGPDKTIAIIDIGANYTHLFVLHAMKLIYSRDEEFGGKQLIEAIAEHYNMTFEQAALAKEQGQLPIDYEVLILEPFKENVLVHIKRMLHFFYSSCREEEVDSILLAGGLSQLPGLVVLIQEQLGIEVSVINLFSHMRFGKMIRLESINNDAPSFMVACGLALRNIGLSQ